MKNFKLSLVVLLSFVGLINAMNIETGQEFPMEKMPRILGCAEFIKQAADKLQALYERVQNEKNMLQRVKFASQADSDRQRKKMEIHIKGTLKDVRQILDKAEKEAPVAL